MSQNTVKLGVVMDPIADIAYKKDTTLALLWAAKAKGWSLYYLDQEDLYLYEGRAMGSVRTLDVHHDPDHWFDLGEREAMPLGELDVILMRKDPPVDGHFLNAVHLLAFAEREGTLVVNPTRALFECNEKLFAQQFTHCIPPVWSLPMRRCCAPSRPSMAIPSSSRSMAWGAPGSFISAPRGATSAR